MESIDVFKNKVGFVTQLSIKRFEDTFYFIFFYICNIIWTQFFTNIEGVSQYLRMTNGYFKTTSSHFIGSLAVSV